MGGGFAHGAFFHLRDSRGNGNDYSGFCPHSPPVHFGNEMPQHRFGHFKVGDDAVFQWTYRHDVSRRSAQHPLGFVADGEDLVGARLHGHHGRLAQHDPLIFDVNERIRRSEINPDIAGKPTEKSFEH